MPLVDEWWFGSTRVCVCVCAALWWRQLATYHTTVTAQFSFKSWCGFPLQKKSNCVGALVCEFVFFLFRVTSISHINLFVQFIIWTAQSWRTADGKGTRYNDAFNKTLFNTMHTLLALFSQCTKHSGFRQSAQFRSTGRRSEASRSSGLLHQNAINPFPFAVLSFEQKWSHFTHSLPLFNQIDTSTRPSLK